MRLPVRWHGRPPGFFRIHPAGWRGAYVATGGTALSDSPDKPIFARVERVHVYGLDLTAFIDAALAEDIGDGDHTTRATVSEKSVGHAVITAKEDGVLCGAVVADAVFNRVDSRLKVRVLSGDGSAVRKGDVVLTVEGPVASILTAERLALNFMQRMSGIATATRRLADAIAGTGARLLDTRKTTPNFRRFEKWAVLAGGGTNHRHGLYDMILIKDNHVDACGGVRAAITAARNYLDAEGRRLPVEVETRTLDEVREALAAGGVDRILLDNFSVDGLKEAVALIGGAVETEASGNIREENIRSVALTGVNYISVGALTHSTKSLDLSLTLRA